MFPLSEKHIHSFNPKTNSLETLLNQTGEKKKKRKTCKEISKTGRFFNVQYDHTICSLVLNAFVFSDRNSTENVPKTIYSDKIALYR